MNTKSPRGGSKNLPKICKQGVWQNGWSMLDNLQVQYQHVRELKLDVYCKVQTAKNTPDFVFFSSNPLISHMNGKTFATSHCKYTKFHSTSTTHATSFIFAVNLMLITSVWIGRQVTKMNKFNGNYVFDIMTKFYNYILLKCLAIEVHFQQIKKNKPHAMTWIISRLHILKSSSNTSLASYDACCMFLLHVFVACFCCIAMCLKLVFLNFSIICINRLSHLVICNKVLLCRQSKSNHER